MQANYIPDSSTLTLEIAHVLFMDVVAYSQLTMEEQTRIIQLLQRIVRNTAAFDNAQKHRRLLRLPTGDGMALVFFGDAAAPVRCAMQISQALREQTDLKLRMGINTGPVQRVADINAARNVAGGGINVAQRVMDCGDAGHILVSKTAADVLDQAGKWKPALHDLGEAEVKHGVRVHLYNLYTEEAGNPELPQKLRTARTAAATILSRSKRKRLSLEAIGIGVIAAIVAGGFYFRSHHTKPLTEEDTIVLAEFDNKTGDPAFDDALKQALAVQLGQSPFLNILSDQRVSETLRMMGRPANERITADVGGEICQRTGSTAVIGWTITSWGSHYLIDLNAVACSTGDTLAKEQSEAAGKENVLKALSRASSSLRAKLGESLPSVQKFDIPVEATTSSLEALKNYSMGVRKQQEKGDAPSIPFYKRAIELDPNFPMAYDELSVRYYNLGQPSLALKYATKAYQLRDKVTDREKLHISADYFSATGELDKEEQTYELWITSYPRDSIPHGYLAGDYFDMGQYNKALGEYQVSLRLSPDDVVNYSNLGLTYLSLGRLDEAKATFDQAVARKLDSESLHEDLYLFAFLRGDQAQMAEQVARGMSDPEDGLSTQSDTDAYHGRLHNARVLSRRAVESAIRTESKESAALWQVNAALREAEVGNTAFARQGVAAALALSQERFVKSVAALTLARVGDASGATALAKELQKSFPTNTLLNFYWLPTINAEIELRHENSSKAIVLLEPATPYELSMGGNESLLYAGYPAYVRGQAYLLAHNGTAAAAEFQKLLDHPGIMLNFETGALAHLQIGRAYFVAGDSAKAKTAYEDFFNLWKDADPDIPVLKDAKAEYARIQ